jgi:hypothetical protein
MARVLPWQAAGFHPAVFDFQPENAPIADSKMPPRSSPGFVTWIRQQVSDRRMEFVGIQTYKNDCFRLMVSYRWHKASGMKCG